MCNTAAIITHDNSSKSVSAKRILRLENVISHDDKQWNYKFEG